MITFVDGTVTKIEDGTESGMFAEPTIAIDGLELTITT
jgi:hypothetical protein